MVEFLGYLKLILCPPNFSVFWREYNYGSGWTTQRNSFYPVIIRCVPWQWNHDTYFSQVNSLATFLGLGYASSLLPGPRCELWEFVVSPVVCPCYGIIIRFRAPSDMSCCLAHHADLQWEASLGEDLASRFLFCYHPTNTNYTLAFIKHQLLVAVDPDPRVEQVLSISSFLHHPQFDSKLDSFESFKRLERL